MFSLGSLQTSPVCQLFHGDPSTVTSNLAVKLKTHECNEAVAEAAIAVVGAAIGGVGLKKRLSKFLLSFCRRLVFCDIRPIRNHQLIGFTPIDE